VDLFLCLNISEISTKHKLQLSLMKHRPYYKQVVK